MNRFEIKDDIKQWQPRVYSVSCGQTFSKSFQFLKVPGALLGWLKKILNGYPDTGEFSKRVVSAVRYTIYNIYLSLCTQTAETTSPEPFSRIPLQFMLSHSHWSMLLVCYTYSRHLIGQESRDEWISAFIMVATYLFYFLSQQCTR